MESKLVPIGFEGIVASEMKSYIGFEQYEDEQVDNISRVYPRDDTMPIPNQPIRNNFDHSSNYNTNSHQSTKRTLSYPQVFSIYNEIVNEWSKIQWLIFTNNHTKTYLTLDSDADEFVTVQMAIDQYQCTSITTSLISLPECLLIRTKSRTQALFLPNSIISIENLCDTDITQRLFQYKLMAIICSSNNTNNKIMFYKDFQTNFWYIFCEQSIPLHSYSNKLTNEEQCQLELFIQPKDQLNNIDLSKFTSSLSALSNHPIIYVYIPAKNN
ncbi:unnamed protein product [Adineta steineri]|uniref:Uncharacterized protein n=1 Tax=Adineta steineri TaxID=433720 RepID=A0A813ZGC8_9BILA|nr:unnamed protein product [Adineta steineri]CAF1428370.1 unnamed protein product [Adineta steineri]